jgi:DNA-binding IclR family transcriptional regulator
MNKKLKDISGSSGGVQSVEIGTKVLLAVMNGGGPMGLKSIAAESAMPAAKAHRYLVSLIRSGLVEQDEATGKYDLGPVSLQIGLSAIIRLNVVRTAVPIVSELREKLNESIMLTVWGDHGPTIVHWEESLIPVTVNARIGSVLPILGTASGHAYLTWLPKQQTNELVKAEIRRGGTTMPFDVDTIIKRTKKHGLAYFEVGDMRSLSSLAAPIFNLEGSLIAVITAFGYKGSFDNKPNGPHAGVLKDAAKRISEKMGFNGEAP